MKFVTFLKTNHLILSVSVKEFSIIGGESKGLVARDPSLLHHRGTWKAQSGWEQRWAKQTALVLVLCAPLRCDRPVPMKFSSRRRVARPTQDPCPWRAVSHCRCWQVVILVHVPPLLLNELQWILSTLGPWRDCGFRPEPGSVDVGWVRHLWRAVPQQTPAVLRMALYHLKPLTPLLSPLIPEKCFWKNTNIFRN